MNSGCNQPAWHSRLQPLLPWSTNSLPVLFPNSQPPGKLSLFPACHKLLSQGGAFWIQVQKILILKKKKKAFNRLLGFPAYQALLGKRLVSIETAMSQAAASSTGSYQRPSHWGVCRGAGKGEDSEVNGGFKCISVSLFLLCIANREGISSNKEHFSPYFYFSSDPWKD